jgi:microcystin degradation protein MlrC
VQSILGIFNYVRNFIPNFSAKAKFLTDKLSAPKVIADVGDNLGAGVKRPASVAALSTSALRKKGFLS